MEIYIVLCYPRQDYLFPAVSSLGYKGGYGNDGSAAVQAPGMGEITAVAVLFRSIPCARAPPWSKTAIADTVELTETTKKSFFII